MKRARFLKDNKNRILHKKTEVLQRILKLFDLYKISKFRLSLITHKFFSKVLIKDNLKGRIKNYCINTGRSRGVFKKIRISRISFRQLGSEGFLFGLKKAGW
jgi:ribosomal protein S14